MAEKQEPSPDFSNFEFEFNKTARNKYENPYLETAKRMTGRNIPFMTNKRR